MLRNIGSSDDGEWLFQYTNDQGQRLVHLRRRVTAKEQEVCGDVKDIRGTPDMWKRLSIMALYNNLSMKQMADMENNNSMVQ